MNSRTTKRFRQMLAKLPSDVRQQAKAAYKLFIENSHHPSLRFKKVHNTDTVQQTIEYINTSRESKGLPIFQVSKAVESRRKIGYKP